MLVVVYVPFLNDAFATVPLSVVHLALVLPAAFVPALAVETVKVLNSRRFR